jgi:hypothetical protein
MQFIVFPISLWEQIHNIEVIATDTQIQSFNHTVGDHGIFPIESSLLPIVGLQTARLTIA